MQQLGGDRANSRDCIVASDEKSPIRVWSVEGGRKEAGEERMCVCCIQLVALREL